MIRALGSRRWAVVWSVLTLAAYSLLPTASLAAVSLSPTLQEVTLLPQEPQTVFELTIANDGDVTQSFNLLVLDFKSLDETGGVAFVGEGERLEKYGLAKWARPERNQITLGPKSETTVRVAIDNRDDLAPGGHYGAVLVRSADQPAGSQVQLRPAAASLLLLRKVGGERFGLRLEELKADGGLFRLPRSVELRVMNTGNVHVVPRGVVRLLDPRGREAARSAINEESGFILPESLRRFTAPLAGRVLWPGRYTVEVQYRYDGNDQFETKTKSFFYLGQAGMALILTTVLAVALAFWQRKRLRKLLKLT